MCAALETSNAFPERAAFYCNVIKESLVLLATGLLAVVGAPWLSRPCFCVCFMFPLVVPYLFRCDIYKHSQLHVAAHSLGLFFPHHGKSGAASQLELNASRYSGLPVARAVSSLLR